MVLSKTLQEKQLELDQFIIEKRGLTPDVISTSELMKNIILACYDEIEEVAEDITNPEEWIDVLHFVLSIANYVGVELHIPTEPIKWNLLECIYELRNDFKFFVRESRCFKHWSDKKGDELMVKAFLECMIDTIHRACEILGVDMVEEYDKKYEINIQRQIEGY